MTEAVSAQRLSTGDLMTLWAQTPMTPMNLGMLALPDPAPLLDATGVVKLAMVRESIADRLDRTPMLRRLIKDTHFGHGRLIWADEPAFDIARHVGAVRLPGADIDRLRSWAASYAAGLLAKSLWRVPDRRCRH